MSKYKKSKNSEVQNFLSDIEIVDKEKLLILQELRKSVFNFFPDVTEEIKYGGIVFINDDLFSGIFIRKNHVSFEFVNGIEMNDPNKLLEGNGKLRRHLKIRSLEDIKDKEVQFFVKQC